MATIGFIGLGNMGLPMASNLVRAGHTVRGYDLVPQACEAARSAGVEVVADAALAVRDAGIVLTMLPAGRHVLGIYKETLLSAARPGTLFVDCSTIDVTEARRAHGMARAQGMESLDAPVSGGVGGATAGTLTFMVGGTAAAFARAQPFLAKMGRRAVHCGDAGAGQAAKLCNNMILGISMIAVSEAFVLAEHLGLSAQALYDVASTSSGQCWSLTTYCPVPGPVPTSPANADYKAGFATTLMLKDLKLADAAAQAAGVATILGHRAAEIYARFEAAGHGGRDFSAIVTDIRARSGNRSEKSGTSG
jgi:3-hydroxyisobutyrate dehydrogenase